MSVYLNEFGYKERKQRLHVINDLYTGDSLKHFIKKWIPDRNKHKIEWRQRYNSYNYFKHIIDQSLDFIVPMDTLSRMKGRMTEAKRNKLNQFYQLNDWKTLLKKIARNRKLYGDVYVYWYFEEDDEENIPRLKVLDSRYVNQYTDSNDKIFAYQYSKEIEYYKEEDILRLATNPDTELTKETGTMSIIYTEGKTVRYLDNREEKTVLSRKEYADIIPIIHLQYQKSDDTSYSEVPAEELIDVSLTLDKVETNIDYINTMVGSPQLIGVDVDLDIENSAVGPNGILYFDTKVDPTNPTSSKKGEVKKVEMSNNLSSQYEQKTEALDIAYEKGNLIPPSVLNNIMKSDSAKVVSSVKQSLENDVLDFYDEVILKMSFIIDVLFGNYPNKVAKFKIPSTSVIESKIDQYIIKSYKMQNGELTMQENLFEQGYTQKEVDERMSEWEAEEVMKANAKKGISQKEHEQDERNDNAKAKQDLESGKVDNEVKKKNAETQAKASEAALKSPSQKEGADQPSGAEQASGAKASDTSEPKVDNNAK